MQWNGIKKRNYLNLLINRTLIYLFEERMQFYEPKIIIPGDSHEREKTKPMEMVF
jgi:hypothetical protein